MENVVLRKAKNFDKANIVDFAYKLSKDEQSKPDMEKKITKAISDDECFIIVADNPEVGFVLFDYRFFEQGWIELIIIAEEYRGKGIGGKVFDLICEQCQAEKVFTSTNSSNTRMQRALAKADFTFAGQIIGLDDGDPELFYYKTVIKK